MFVVTADEAAGFSRYKRQPANVNLMPGSVAFEVSWPLLRPLARPFQPRSNSRRKKVNRCRIFYSFNNKGLRSQLGLFFVFFFLLFKGVFSTVKMTGFLSFYHSKSVQVYSMSRWQRR